MFFIIIGIIMAQMVITGALSPSMKKIIIYRCPDKRHYVGSTYYHSPEYKSCENFHDCHPIVAFFWPITVPFLISSHLGEKYSIGSKDDRIEARRKRELDEARHKTMLSEERAKQLELQEREAGIKK